MRSYTLENYEDKLVHQVVHLDQGLCYCPEFRATRQMHDYPSRKLQLAWSVYKGYLQPTEYTAGLLFQSLLSRQGERWQNFGESPEDLTDVMILCREMMVKKGLAGQTIKDFRDALAKNGGHAVKTAEEALKKWRRHMPVSPDSGIYLLLDDATAAYACDSAPALGSYFREKGIAFHPEIRPVFAGWEYFAYGLVDEGIAHMKGFIDGLKGKNIKAVMTLSGQTEYLLGSYLEKLPVERPFKVMNVLDDCKALKIEEPTYFYAGSFNLRYLNKAEAINALAKNGEEEAVRHCAEFTPLFIADKRVNHLNCWQKPLCAEYRLAGFNGGIPAAIEADAIADILKAPYKQIAVFEPYAYGILKNKMPDEKITYYFDLL